MNTKEVSYVGEVWKDIPKFENEYQASNKGRVRSLDRWVECKDGRKYFVKGKILKQKKVKGYPIVGLCKNGKHKTEKVHRLVYKAFIGEIPEGMQVNHKDENKQNNILSNIDILMTCKENNNWGTHNERVGKAKSKSVIQKNLHGEVIKVWPSAKEVQRQLGYANTNICQCCRGRNYYNTAYGYIWEYYTEKAAS